MPPATITCPVYQLTSIAATIAGVPHSRVFSRERSNAVCRVRFAVWHCIYHTYGWSMPRIAKAAGYKDHVTILNGLSRARKLLKSSPSFHLLVSKLLYLDLQENDEVARTEGGKRS